MAMSSGTTFFFSNMVRNIGDFDLRYLIPIFINSLKSQSQGTTMSLVTYWDSLHTSNNWTVLCFHVFMLLLYSVTSVNISLTRPSPNNTSLIRLQFGNYSPHLLVLLLASLIFPIGLFFYAYPAVLILNSFLSWLSIRLAAFPVWNLHISSSLTHHGTEIHTESDAPMQPQVVVQISPRDPADAD